MKNLNILLLTAVSQVGDIHCTGPLPRILPTIVTGAILQLAINQDYPQNTNIPQKGIALATRARPKKPWQEEQFFNERDISYSRLGK